MGLSSGCRSEAGTKATLFCFISTVALEPLHALVLDRGKSLGRLLHCSAVGPTWRRQDIRIERSEGHCTDDDYPTNDQRYSGGCPLPPGTSSQTKDHRRGTLMGQRSGGGSGTAASRMVVCLRGRRPICQFAIERGGGLPLRSRSGARE